MSDLCTMKLRLMGSVEAFAEHGFHDMRLSGMFRAAGREEIISRIYANSLASHSFTAADK